MAIVETNKQGDVAVIRMDNPPVNALGHALRVGLEKAFAEANADAGVKAIVLTGTGKFFSAGADITEFKGEMKEPFLPALIDTIEKIHATDEPHRTRLRFRRKFQTIASCRPCRTAPTFAAAA